VQLAPFSSRVPPVLSSLAPSFKSPPGSSSSRVLVGRVPAWGQGRLCRDAVAVPGSRSRRSLPQKPLSHPLAGGRSLIWGGPAHGDVSGEIRRTLADLDFCPSGIASSSSEQAAQPVVAYFRLIESLRRGRQLSNVEPDIAVPPTFVAPTPALLQRAVCDGLHSTPLQNRCAGHRYGLPFGEPTRHPCLGTVDRRGPSTLCELHRGGNPPLLPVGGDDDQHRGIDEAIHLAERTGDRYVARLAGLSSQGTARSTVPRGTLDLAPAPLCHTSPGRATKAGIRRSGGSGTMPGRSWPGSLINGGRTSPLPLLLLRKVEASPVCSLRLHLGQIAPPPAANIACRVVAEALRGGSRYARTDSPPANILRTLALSHEQ